MHRPTAAPRIPASASGVSKQRSGPKRSRRPTVARNTPPARPTSSPITSTDGSRSSSTWKQSLIASTIESSAKRPSQLVEIRAERSRRIDVRMREQEIHVGGRLRFRRGDPRAQRVGRLPADRRREIVMQNSCTSKIALEAPEALPFLLLLDSLEVDVRRRVVGRRIRRHPVRHRLEERRSCAGPCTLCPLTRHLVTRYP